MDEYISREAAIKMIEEDLPEVVYYRKEDAIACLECLPNADVVEVVRCKDCKHWHKCLSDDGSVEYIHFSRCTKGNQLANGNDYFCSSGERMTD